jgi:hypothetical protein
MNPGFTVLSLCTAILLTVSCGDDEQDPSGSGTAPEASTLIAVPGSSNTANLTWTSCGSSDFTEYRIYHSLTAGIQANPDQATIISIVTNVSDTTLTDSGLNWNTTYYYAVRTIDSEYLSAWSNEASAAIPDSGSSGALSCYEVQGQQASSPYLNQVVTVTGIVVAGGDEYYSSAAPYAVIADKNGGPWSGLLLYGNSIADVNRGDSIVVTGEVQEFYEMTELGFLEDLQVVSTGVELPQSELITTAQADEEQYESVLVSAVDAVVGAIGPYSYEINDGSGMCHAGTRGNYTIPVQGDTVDIAGTLWFDNDEWRIQPRDNNDITTSGGGGDPLSCYEVQGQQASSPYLGQTVSVTGIVTAGADDYTAVSGSTYAAIADAAGGPWSGLLLFGSDLAGLARGDSVTVTGVVDEYYEMTELKYPVSYVVHSTGHSLPVPEDFTTGELSPLLDLEQWESVFVRVSDVDVTQTGLPHYTWAVDDGSGECYAGTMGDFSYTPTVGNTIAQMTGLLWYSYDFKIQPRDDTDIVQ